MIELISLQAGYPGRAVLQNLSLTIREGEVLALIGPNGSGKTTLLRTVLGLQPRLGGAVLVDGEETRNWTPRRLAQSMSYLAQNRSVPNITAGRMVLHGRFPYLGYPRRYRPEDWKAARAALEQVGAADLADRSMNQLSGGQRQKVYLAMVLAQDTKAVFLDEPTTYLDVAHQMEVTNTARWLAGQGKAVVMVLHDLSLALRRADRVAVLDEGELVCVGTPDEVFSSGELDRVFRIRIRRMQTDSGWHYYYE